MKAVIDFDPLIHIVANVQYAKGNLDNKTEVLVHVRDFYHQILANVRQYADEFIGVFQAPGHKNYRSVIYPGYKAHRTPNEATLLWKSDICAELQRLGAVPLKFIESDDALNILATQNVWESLIVENDKDLGCIQGKHYNPYKKNLTERYWTVDGDMALKSYWGQVLTGDPTDMSNLDCGIKGVGPVSRDNFLKYGSFKLSKKEKETAEEIMVGTIPRKVFDAYFFRYGYPEGIARLYRTINMISLLSHENDLDPHFIVNMPLEHQDLLLEAQNEVKLFTKNVIQYRSTASDTENMFESDSLFDQF